MKNLTVGNTVYAFFNRDVISGTLLNYNSDAGLCFIQVGMIRTIHIDESVVFSSEKEAKKFAIKALRKSLNKLEK